MTSSRTDELPPLEELHRKARAAYNARDVTQYMAVFGPDLRFHQADGRTISHKQLSRDVRIQFRRLSAASSSYRTEKVESVLGDIVETATQWGWITQSPFPFVHHLWRLERHGLYTWRHSQEGWRIHEVTVLYEQVVGHGFLFGWIPQLPPLESIEPERAR